MALEIYSVIVYIARRDFTMIPLTAFNESAIEYEYLSLSQGFFNLLRFLDRR